MGINIKEKATTLREDLRLYWKKPPMGRYMSFKEIVSLAVGGLGIQFVVFCAQNMIISIGNTLISNTIGIAPKPLYIIYIMRIYRNSIIYIKISRKIMIFLYFL